MYTNYNEIYSIYISHSGVKGMKWGVRRQAKKDAKEYTKAKSFYGEGAGTRRKLIKQKVEYNSKHIPDYKKAFDYYVKNTNMRKRADQAVRERKVKNAKNKTAKTVRGVGNILAGRIRYAPATLAAAYGTMKIGQSMGIIPPTDELKRQAVKYGRKAAYNARKYQSQIKNMYRKYTK